MIKMRNGKMSNMKNIKKNNKSKKTLLINKKIKDDIMTNVLNYSDVYAVSEDDPIYHFKGILYKEELDNLCDIENWSRSEFSYEYMGRSFVETPEINIPVRSAQINHNESLKYPTPITGKFPDLTVPLDIKKHMEEHLLSRIASVNEFSPVDDVGLTPLQNELLSIMGRYADLYYTEAKYKHLEEIRFAYCLHVLNHLSKRRSEIVHNNEVFKIDHMKLCRKEDQGFTRPKVLILAPFKNSAYKIVKTIISILFKNQKGVDIRSLSKFEADFGPQEEVRPDRLNRPADFHATFEGNRTEDFIIGIKLTKSSIKLYAEFLHSDIIIASPLGLKLAIGSKKTKNLDTDLVCSIEVLILDQADSILMQNWDNVVVVLKCLNLRLQKITNSLNIHRLRRWTLTGYSSYYRQTIIFSSFLDVYNRAVYMKSRNFAGRVEVIHHINLGTVEEISVRSEVNLWYYEFNDPEGRRNYFIKNILPNLAKLAQVLLYIPDYLDYVLLVHYLLTHGGVEFSTLNEYMINEAPGKISEARSSFYERRRSMIIMTERFHFYRRYRIKGIKNVIFYSLPQNPNFVPEVCNWMADEYQHPHLEEYKQMPTITTLYDEPTLSNMCHFVGTAKTEKLWNAKSKFSTFSIYAEGK